MIPQQRPDVEELDAFLKGPLDVRSLSLSILMILAIGGMLYIARVVIMPTIVGQRLTLNPVAIFIWLTLWGWLWGVPGILLAAPLLATLKIVCDHVRPLNPVGEFLGD